MAQPLRNLRETAAAPAPRAVARVADAERDFAVDSPARMMQQALSLDMADLDDRSDRWPPSATLAFILVTCGGFWITAIYLTMQLLKLR
eukprot:gene17748-17964_t